MEAYLRHHHDGAEAVSCTTLSYTLHEQHSDVCTRVMRLPDPISDDHAIGMQRDATDAVSVLNRILEDLDDHESQNVLVDGFILRHDLVSETLEVVVGRDAYTDHGVQLLCHQIA